VPPVAGIRRSDETGLPAWALAFLVPAVAIGAAYAYWVAYAWVLSIPVELVRVEPADGLAAFAALGVLLLVFNGILGAVRSFAPSLPWWIREPADGTFEVLAVGTLTWLAVPITAVRNGVATICVASLGLSYVSPLWNQKTISGYAAKLKAETKRVRELPPDDEPFVPSPANIFAKRFPSRARQFALAGAVIWLAALVGLGSAISKQSFYVTDRPPQELLLGVISDRAFFRSIDCTSTAQVRVQSASEMPPMHRVDGLSHAQLKALGIAALPD